MNRSLSSITSKGVRAIRTLAAEHPQLHAGREEKPTAETKGWRTPCCVQHDSPLYMHAYVTLGTNPRFYYAVDLLFCLAPSLNTIQSVGQPVQQDLPGANQLHRDEVSLDQYFFLFDIPCMYMLFSNFLSSVFRRSEHSRSMPGFGRV